MLNLYSRTVRLFGSDYPKKPYYPFSKFVLTLKDKFFIGVLLLLTALFTMNIIVYTQSV